MTSDEFNLKRASKALNKPQLLELTFSIDCSLHRG